MPPASWRSWDVTRFGGGAEALTEDGSIPKRKGSPSPSQTLAPSPAPAHAPPTSTQEAAQPASPSDEPAPLSTPTLEPLVTPISEEQYEKELDAFLFTLLHWKTNFRLRSVPFIGITAGGPPKDGIPAIDDPKFVSVEDADEWLDDRAGTRCGAERRSSCLSHTDHDLARDSQRRAGR